MNFLLSRQQEKKCGINFFFQMVVQSHRRFQLECWGFLVFVEILTVWKWFSIFQPKQNMKTFTQLYKLYKKSKSKGSQAQNVSAFFTKNLMEALKFPLYNAPDEDLFWLKLPCWEIFLGPLGGPYLMRWMIFCDPPHWLATRAELRCNHDECLTTWLSSKTNI